MVDIKKGAGEARRCTEIIALCLARPDDNSTWDMGQGSVSQQPTVITQQQLHNSSRSAVAAAVVRV